MAKTANSDDPLTSLSQTKGARTLEHAAGLDEGPDEV